jgi:hypothetical protein
VAPHEQSFKNVLAALKPELILVWGRSNWQNLPKLGGRKSKPLTDAKGHYTGTWLYPIPSRRPALAIHVKHPGTAYAFEKFVAGFQESEKRAMSKRN